MTYAQMAARAKRAMQGAQNKAAGRYFEQIIGAACSYYRDNGIADIDKTPEPTKQLTGKNSKGQFTACYEKRAQPDFKGTVAGGQSVVFEAKFTSTEKMSQSVVLPQQEESLDRHAALGASCFVLVGFGMNDWFRIPWTVWKEMKQVFGRKYITQADVEQYRVKRNLGVMDFLRVSEEKSEGKIKEE